MTVGKYIIATQSKNSLFVFEHLVSYTHLLTMAKCGDGEKFKSMSSGPFYQEKLKLRRQIRRRVRVCAAKEERKRIYKREYVC